MKNLLVRFVREEEGQDLIEYALLCALIAVVLVASMEAVAEGIDGVFQRVIAALAAA
jgi:pilus assembly protein Flp/PilA